MRAIFSAVINTSITVTLLLFLISQLQQSDPPTVEIDFESSPRESWPNRLKNIHFSVPVESVSGYDYSFPAAKSQDQPVNQMSSGVYSYPPLDSRFYISNEVSHGSLSIAGSRIFDTNFQYDEAHLRSLRKYYTSLVVPQSSKPARFRLTHVDFLSYQEPAPYEQQRFSYAYQEDRVIQVLQSQFEAAYLLFPGAANSMATVAITPGDIPENLTRQGVFGRRRAAEQVARNILQALREVRRANEQAKFTLLIKNSYPASYKQGDLAKILCVEITECVDIVQQIQRLNNSYGRPLENPEQQVGLLIDTAAVVASWQQKSSPYYKNSKGRPLTMFQFIDSTETELASSSQLIRGLEVSYAEQNADQSSDYTLYRPFSRAIRAENAYFQLRVAAFFYNQSMMGSDPNMPGFITGRFNPARQIPVLHEIFLPIANLLDLYYEKEGALRWEQEYSLRLMQHYLEKNTL